MQQKEIIIIGAGAAGLMCAREAALRGLDVTILEHTGKVGEKIRISGGGRCNFTNLYCGPDNFLSQNPHFCKSALSRYDQHDFIALVKEHGIAYHEKHYTDKPGNENARGQLFCDNSATDIITMLKNGFEQAGGKIQLKTKVTNVEKTKDGFHLQTDKGEYTCKKLVIATGGLSIPKIGASNFGYEQAKKFDLNIIPPRAALVPLTFNEKVLAQTKELSGIAVDAHISAGEGAFREGMLFTHRGLSGPSVLQISSYWIGGQDITVNLAPDTDMFEWLKQARQKSPKQHLRTILGEILPNRVVEKIINADKAEARIADLSDQKLVEIAQTVNTWQIKPDGTEGYRTAEVTIGGVDTNDISSKTFEAKSVPGLYFIGEVLDVTGHLGGHNFQWAWSSGWCAAQHL